MSGRSGLFLDLLTSGLYPQGQPALLFLGRLLPKVGRSRDSGLRVRPDLSPTSCGKTSPCPEATRYFEGSVASAH